MTHTTGTCSGRGIAVGGGIGGCGLETGIESEDGF
jgi:hypothetical protein